MEYKIIRHAEGDERKNHKYVARVLLDKASGKYKYFYDQKAYQAYLAVKQKYDDVVDTVRSDINNSPDAKTYVKTTVSRGKDFVEDYIKKKGDAVVNASKSSDESSKNFVKTALTGGVGLAIAGSVYNAVADKRKKV